MLFSSQQQKKQSQQAQFRGAIFFRGPICRRREGCRSRKRKPDFRKSPGTVFRTASSPILQSFPSSKHRPGETVPPLCDHSHLDGKLLIPAHLSFPLAFAAYDGEVTVFRPASARTLHGGCRGRHASGESLPDQRGHARRPNDRIAQPAVPSSSILITSSGFLFRFQLPHGVDHGWKSGVTMWVCLRLFSPA